MRNSKIFASTLALATAFVVHTGHAQMMSQDTFGSMAPSESANAPAAVNVPAAGIVTTTTTETTQTSEETSQSTGTQAGASTSQTTTVAPPALTSSSQSNVTQNVTVVQAPPLVKSTEPVYDDNQKGAARLADAEPVVLEPQTQGNVTFVAGGIGARERLAMQQSEKNYNLKVLNSDKKSLLVGGNTISVSNKTGNILQTESGPVLLAKLPAGTYTVTVAHGGKTQSKKVTVGKSLSRNSFVW